MTEAEKRLGPPLLIAQIGFLHTLLRKGCDGIFREQGFPLEMDQLPVLLSLYYSGAASQQEIYTRLLRDKASVNRTVAFLARKGIVTTTSDPDDGRKTRVELTPAGKKLAQKADAVIKKYDAKLSSVLTAEEKRQFHRLMDKLIEVDQSSPFRIPL